MEKSLQDIPLPDNRELYDLVTTHNEKYTEPTIIERARTDAAKNLPAGDSKDPSPFEKQLVHDASILASKVSSHYKRSLEMLDAKVKAEQQGLKHLKDTIKNRSAGFQQIEEEGIENSYALRSARERVGQADDRYSTFYSKYGRGPVIYIPHWLYVIFAVLIFAGEIPLNALVFTIFGESMAMTWVMAGIVGLSIPLGAHFIGIKFRERSEGHPWANWLKGFAALAVLVAALYGLSHMRTAYLGEFREDLGLTEPLVRTSFEFFWLNVAVLGAAIMISYLSHDSIPGYQEAAVELQRARKALDKLERRRLKDLSRSRYKTYCIQKDSDENVRLAENRVVMLKGYYDMVLREGQELEYQCLQGMRHDVELYRSENLQHRNDNNRPPCFSNDLEFPLVLKELNEKLVSEETL